MNCRLLSSCRRACMIVAIAALAIGDAGGTSAQVTMLYESKIPANSSYVRVASAAAAPANVAIGSSAPVVLSAAGTPVTTYRLVPGGTNLVITVDGKPMRPVSVPANKYLTLIYRPGSSVASLATITDNPGDDTGVLAELRFYNLVQNCAGALALGNGATVFEGVASDESRSRSINPVAATLIPKCGSTAGAPMRLPLLKAQSQYSIFLAGDAGKPIAVGIVDATESTKNP